MTSAWNEDDIIFALVAHLRDQGIDEVFVLDDRSDDRTAHEAQAAGATVHLVSTGDRFSEEDRSLLIGDAIDQATQGRGDDVWWLVCDADEFPTGPGGQTVRGFVEDIPPEVDVVGATVLDHLPNPIDEYVRRAPPLPFFPLAIEHTDPYCPNGHWKHPLFRLPRVGEMYPSPGQHIVMSASGAPAVEHHESLVVHHFPVRSRATTEGRLARLLERGGRYDKSPEEWQRWHGNRRLASLDAIYAGRYDEVPVGFTPTDSGMGIDPRPWRDLLQR